jgi:GTP-binding protein EngB required for normal cell division/uncharacterized protein (DUF697 family)
VRIWKIARDAWLRWRSMPARTRPTEAEATAPGEQHLALARETLKELLTDERVPASVRDSLASEYATLRDMLEKLEHGHVHVAVLGRVGVGKSSLLNALLGERRFAVSPLHGETRSAARAGWSHFDAGGVFLIDTPGLDEVEGGQREEIALEAARQADLVLFVVEGDLTAGEMDALRTLLARQTAVLVVLNKQDRYTDAERRTLLAAVRERLADLLPAEQVVAAAADPRPEVVLKVSAAGTEERQQRPVAPDIAAVRDRLWLILEQEGKSLAALNASLFAGELSDRVSDRLIEIRRVMGERVIRTYCIGKGVAVALNPVPVADLVTVAMIDVSLVAHLSRVYGLPLTRREAGSLVTTIITQMAAVMGTVWGVHLLSSALKLGTGGLSIALTAGAQGAVAYYGTYVVGRVAQQYLAQGRAWGPGGPKATVASILESIDRDSLLGQARDEIRARLRAAA